MKKIKLLTIIFLFALTLALPGMQTSPTTTAKAVIVVTDGNDGSGDPSDSGGSQTSGGSSGTGSTIEKLIKTVTSWLYSGSTGGDSGNDHNG